MKRLFILLAACVAIPAFADRDEGHEHRTTFKADPVWLKECGSCHVAYPANMLPAASWKKLMGGLQDHFGTDASLTPDEQRHVTDFLVGQAGRGSASSLRITQSAWFRHEHDEVRADVWKRAAVKSPANCQACHLEAAQGRFDEHAIRIPR